MPKITEIKPTRVYKEVQTAYDRGFRIVSAQGGTRSGKTYNIGYEIRDEREARQRVAERMHENYIKRKEKENESE